MEIKRFNEYTKDEQKQLLFHWWNYYGKLPLRLDEFERFEKLLDEDITFVKNAALVAWAKNSASQDLVRAMRGDLQQFKDQIVELVNTQEFIDIEDVLEESFVEEVVGTYNKPEPAIPMSDDEILAEVCKMLGVDSSEIQIINISAEDIMKDDEFSDTVLTSEKVHEIYRECLLKKEELANGEPAVDFTVGEGVMHTGVFNSERLARRKEQIVSMVDELPDIDQGPSFLELCFDKHGRQWTGEHSTMDLLVQLGIATDSIQFVLPRDCWRVLPGGMPCVIRNRKKDMENIVGKKPAEYKKVIEGLNNKNS